MNKQISHGYALKNYRKWKIKERSPIERCHLLICLEYNIIEFLKKLPAMIDEHISLGAGEE